MINIRDEEFLLRLGRHIQAVRKAEGKTQEDVAYEADVPVSQISRIERGLVNPTVSTMNVIAKAIKVPLTRLFDFEP